jgi:hypothetical protein
LDEFIDENGGAQAFDFESPQAGSQGNNLRPRPDAGTGQRFSGLSQPCECGEAVLQMLVTGARPNFCGGCMPTFHFGEPWVRTGNRVTVITERTAKAISSEKYTPRETGVVYFSPSVRASTASGAGAPVQSLVILAT